MSSMNSPELEIFILMVALGFEILETFEYES